MPSADSKDILTQARDRAAALVASLQRDQASLSKAPGGPADEGLAKYAAAVDAAERTYNNLQRALGHGD